MSPYPILRRVALLLVTAGLAFGLFLRAPLVQGEDDVAAQEPYVQAVGLLEKWLRQEVEAKRLPSLTSALVDDQRIVWSHRFGFADPKKQNRATGDTVYRVGSVS